MEATIDKIKQHKRYGFFGQHDIPLLFLCHTIEDYSTTWLQQGEHSEKNMKNFEVYMDYYNNIADYINKGMGMYISGSFGVGKTLLIVILINRYLYVVGNVTGMDRVEFITSASLVELFNFKLTDKQEDKKENILEYCRLLIIDDLGKLALTKNAKEISQIENILRERYFRMRPCFITSQGGVLSEGITEIINDKYVQVNLVGESYRVDLKEEVEDV